MLKFLTIVAIVLALVAGGLFAYAASQPETFHIARSTSIKAPPEKIFPLINDMKSFGIWSPYEKKDPDMKRSFSGPAAGKAATYAWAGDHTIGKGEIEITDSSAPSKVTFNLRMIEPMAASNIVNFTLEPTGDATKVTWAMDGRSPLIGRVMCLFFDMDKMVGGDFETGLANLKALAES